MKKKKNNELQRIMVISFSKEIPIHHEPMITFIVTTSILFFFSHRHIDRSPRSYHRPTTKLKLTRTSRNFIRRPSLRDRKRRHSRKGFSLIKPREREEGRERERAELGRWKRTREIREKNRRKRREEKTSSIFGWNYS